MDALWLLESVLRIRVKYGVPKVGIKLTEQLIGWALLFKSSSLCCSKFSRTCQVRTLIGSQSPKILRLANSCGRHDRCVHRRLPICLCIC
jgi:hypothetical protein